MSWVSWQRLLASKDQGGWGIGCLRAMIISLLLKWLWRFKCEPESLWVRVITSIHGNRYPLLQFPYKKKIVGPWGSTIKAALELPYFGLNVTDLLKCKVGSGTSAMFWLDSWSDSGILKDKFPGLYKLESCKKCSVADRITTDNGSLSLAWRWRRQPSSEDEMVELNNIMHELRRVHISADKDQWIREVDDSRSFSVKSTRSLVEALCLPINHSRFIWSPLVPIKVNMVCWRAFLDRLPVNLQLINRGITIRPNCSWCGWISESINHVMMQCPLACQVWMGNGVAAPPSAPGLLYGGYFR